MDKTITITIECKGEKKVVSYVLPSEEKWDRKNSPLSFRRANSDKIDELGKTLESVGLAIIKNAFPDTNMFDYYAYFHPILNESKLKTVEEYFKGRK